MKGQFARTKIGWCGVGRDQQKEIASSEGSNRKAVFEGKVKRKKKEHEERTEDETENDVPDVEVEGGGCDCRQKGWWKRGDVEAKLNTVNI